MKLRDLFEINSRGDLPGPGDDLPGDKDIPGSPSYDPIPSMKQSQYRGGRASKEDDYYYQQEIKAGQNRARLNSQITDRSVTQQIVNGQSITIDTGVAANEDIAKQYLHKTQGWVWDMKGHEFIPLEDGRVQYKLTYIG